MSLTDKTWFDLLALHGEELQQLLNTVALEASDKGDSAEGHPGAAEQEAEASPAEPTNVDVWLAQRKEAGKRIDPKTAKLRWSYEQVLDPYGVLGVTAEMSCVGREYFAADPDEGVWVCFGDLPDEVSEALWSRARAEKGMFPWV